MAKHSEAIKKKDGYNQNLSIFSMVKIPQTMQKWQLEMKYAAVMLNRKFS